MSAVIEKIEIIPFQETHAAEVSALITKNLWEVNVADYAADELSKVEAGYLPDALLREPRDAIRFVAVRDGEIIGTVALSRAPTDADVVTHTVQGLFVRVSDHGQGVGRLLMDHIEGHARRIGIDKLTAHASITAREFYLRLDYRPEDDSDGYSSTDQNYTLSRYL